MSLPGTMLLRSRRRRRRRSERVKGGHELLCFLSLSLFLVFFKTKKNVEKLFLSPLFLVEIILHIRGGDERRKTNVKREKKAGRSLFVVVITKREKGGRRRKERKTFFVVIFDECWGERKSVTSRAVVNRTSGSVSASIRGLWVLLFYFPRRKTE